MDSIVVLLFEKQLAPHKAPDYKNKKEAHKVMLKRVTDVQNTK